MRPSGWRSGSGSRREWAALRPDLAKRFEIVSPGEHLRRFAARFCRHTRAVPDGRELGSPFELESWEVELFDEALAVDEHGHRIYSFVVLVIPRKCGKTAIAALVALYLASPADGEHRPEVILAAGFLKQTARLWESASAFIVDPKSARWSSDAVRRNRVGRIDRAGAADAAASIPLA